MAEPLQNKLVLRLGHVRASAAATLGLRTSLFSKTKGFARHSWPCPRKCFLKEDNSTKKLKFQVSYKSAKWSKVGLVIGLLRKSAKVLIAFGVSKYYIFKEYICELHRRIVIRVFLFVFLFASLVFARGGSVLGGDRIPVYPAPKDTLTDEQLAELPPIDWSIDSTEIYHQLVLTEIPESYYAQNIFGIVFGGALTAAGLYCVASVPLLLVGGPILGYNIYYLNEHRAHARQRDEYLKAENAYKRRRAAGNPNAVNISIVPTINFAHAGGGMNLMVAF